MDTYREFRALCGWQWLLYCRGLTLADAADDDKWEHLVGGMLRIPPRFAREINRFWPVADTGNGFVCPHVELCGIEWRIVLADPHGSGTSAWPATDPRLMIAPIGQGYREALCLVNATVLVLDGHVKVFSRRVRRGLRERGPTYAEAKIERLAQGLSLACGRRLTRSQLLDAAVYAGLDLVRAPPATESLSEATADHRLLDALLQREAKADIDRLLKPATTAEREVLELLRAGYSLTDAAQQLGISDNAARQRFHGFKKKIGGPT